MAGHLMPWLRFNKWRRRFPANRHDMRAARVKAAAGGWIERAWNITNDILPLAA
jgi:hypothetical protein